MIVYKVDKSSHAKTSAQIKDMAAVLEEIAPTLQVLQKLLNEHGNTISTPTVDEFRNSLQHTIATTIPQVRRIADQAQQLRTVSDQASKHLVAVDEHFGGALREKSNNSSNNVRVPAQVQ